MPTEDFYKAQIAPLKNKYGLTTREANFLSSMKGQQGGSFDNMMDALSFMQRMRSSQIQYEASVMAFNDRKEAKRNERKYAEKAEVLTQQLDDALRFDDIFDAVDNIEKLKVKNIKAYGESELVRNLFDSAKTRAANAAKRESSNRKGGAIQGIASQGLLSREELEELAKADGVIDETERLQIQIGDRTYKETERRKELADKKAGLTGIESFITRKLDPLKQDARDIASLKTDLRELVSLISKDVDRDKGEKEKEIQAESAGVFQNLTHLGKFKEGTDDSVFIYKEKEYNVKNKITALSLLSRIEAQAKRDLREAESKTKAEYAEEYTKGTKDLNLGTGVGSGFRNAELIEQLKNLSPEDIKGLPPEILEKFNKRIIEVQLDQDIDAWKPVDQIK